MGLLALPVGYFALGTPTRSKLALLWTWSVLGLVSAVLAQATAIWHSLLDNHAMQALSHYPLALIPSFFMPLVITAHILFIGRLVSWAMKRDDETLTSTFSATCDE